MTLHDAPPGIATAESLYRSGAIAQAVLILNPLAHGPPERADALSLLGLCNLRIGHAIAGLRQLERAHALAPDDALIALRHGIGLQVNQRHAEAAACFRDCCARLPTDPAPAVNLAAALLDLGDAPAALLAAREARTRAPSLAAGHYTCGRALMACHRFTEAVTSFRTALHHAPDLLDAWIALGHAAYRTGALGDAIQAMRRATAMSPHHQGACASLATLLRLAGEVETAEALLDQALAAEPMAPEPRLSRAAMLLQEEQSSAALKLLSGPPPAGRDLAAHWALSRSLALLQMNDTKAARKELAALDNAPPDLAVPVAWRRVLLARAEGRDAEAACLADAMERTLAEDRAMLPEHRIMAHFDLARFWAGRGQAERAFHGWTAGHRALAQFQPFSRDAWQDFVDASIEQFDAGRLRGGARASGTDPAPVFIVGMPRSGTTLLEQILAAHPAVHAAGERSALGEAFRTLGGGTEDRAAVARIVDRTAAEFDRVAEPYLATLHAMAPNAPRIVDKLPGNFARLGLIALLFPGARIIHCTRDPRDIGLSIFTYRFYGQHPYAHDLGDLGWYIGQHARLMDHWLDAVPNPILTVRLDDWVKDFRMTLLQVLAFLDLPYDPACERFWEVKRRVRTVSRTQVARPVNAAGLGRWQPYRAWLDPLLAELRKAGLPGADD